MENNIVSVLDTFTGKSILFVKETFKNTVTEASDLFPYSITVKIDDKIVNSNILIAIIKLNLFEILATCECDKGLCWCSDKYPIYFGTLAYLDMFCYKSTNPKIIEFKKLVKIAVEKMRKAVSDLVSDYKPSYVDTVFGRLSFVNKSRENEYIELKILTKKYGIFVLHATGIKSIQEGEEKYVDSSILTIMCVDSIIRNKPDLFLINGFGDECANYMKNINIRSTIELINGVELSNIFKNGMKHFISVFTHN